MDWKRLIALAALIAPLAYCQIEADKRTSEEKITCMNIGGTWSNAWGGYCTQPDPQ